MNVKFLQDRHWYAALLLATGFWILYGFFISPLRFNNIFEPLNVFLLSVLLYPIVEEFVFRGVVQEYFTRQARFKANFLGISLANIITSVLFAASHLVNQEPFWALLTFFPSLIFGYFKDRHNNLLSCISVHIFYNLGFFVLMAK